MATKKPKKVKSAAAAAAQTRDECAAQIRELGDLQRAIARRTADMNDAIAVITAQHQPELDKAAADIKRLALSVQAWCETNRAEITEGGKTKTVNLITGEVSWRVRPPSCKISGEEAVIKTIKALGLAARYLRTKTEIDKDAILAAAAAARNAPETDKARAALVAEADKICGVSGIKVVTGVEDFAITPAEIEVPS